MVVVVGCGLREESGEGVGEEEEEQQRRAKEAAPGAVIVEARADAVGEGVRAEDAEEREAGGVVLRAGGGVRGVSRGEPVTRRGCRGAVQQRAGRWHQRRARREGLQRTRKRVELVEPGAVGLAKAPGGWGAASPLLVAAGRAGGQGRGWRRGDARRRGSGRKRGDADGRIRRSPGSRTKHRPRERSLTPDSWNPLTTRLTRRACVFVRCESLTTGTVPRAMHRHASFMS